MSSESVASFVWPMVNHTVSIVALVLAVVIFIFGMFSGTRANKGRMVFAAALATTIYEIITVTLSDIGMASRK